MLLREHLSVSPAFRLERFRHGTVKAAVDGNLEALKWWSAKYLPNQPLDARKLCKKAARNGHMSILQWLEEKGLLPTPELQYVVCNSAPVVYWLHARPHFRINVPMNSAEGGLAFVQWLHEHEGQSLDFCASNALVGANERGDLEMIKWLLVNRTYLREVSDLYFTLRSTNLGQQGPSEWPYDSYPYDLWDLPEPLEFTEGHLRVARWLSTEYDWTKSDSYYSEMAGQWAQKTAMRAAACSNFEMIRIIRECDALDPQDSIDFGALAWTAARFGHLEMVQWLHEEDNICQTQALRGAAVGGHLHILQWLQQQESVYWLPDILDLAAWGGHLEILQWMHQTHEPLAQIEHHLNVFDPALEDKARAMDGAAGQGHLQVVQWLHENWTQGCTVKAMDDAAANGHFQVVQYLHEHRTEGCSTLAMDQAASNGHLDIVKFLNSHRSEGYSCEAMTGAAANGHLDVIRWLHENCLLTWEQEAVDEAARNGHLRVVKFLTLQCQLQCSDLAREQATRRGHFAVIEWLQVHDL